MTAFLVVAGLLVVGALLFVLPPLLGASDDSSRPTGGNDGTEVNFALLRMQIAELEADHASGKIDTQQAARGRAEIERRVLEDSRAVEQTVSVGPKRALRSAAAIGVLVPLAATVIYLNLGNLEGIDAVPTRAAKSGAHAVTPDQIRAMVERLAARLEQDPSDVSGWLMLARSRSVLGEYAGAVQAYARAAELRPRDAQVLADYADTLAMAKGRRLEGEPEAIIQMALAADARHPKALALAGSAAFEQRDFSKAIGYWQRLLSIAPEGSEFARSVQGSIDDATRRAAGEGEVRGALVASNVVEDPIASGRNVTTRGRSPRITGTVRLDGQFAQQAAANDTVFIFARAAEGTRAPLAILRKRVADLPMEFTLDDSLAMNPSLKLSSVDRLIVTARVSRSGQAAAQPGDLEGSSDPVNLGAAGLAIEINRVVR